MVVTRSDAWSLEGPNGWHPVLEAYARAVLVMQQRPASDPTSWRYQAAVHGTSVRPDRWRNQCQHNTWYFLPWHRMYLAWFERTVRAVVQTLREVGPATKASWALPYWDYGRSSETRALPPAFRTTTLPDGSPNPLRVPGRNQGLNAGARLPASAASAASALRQTVFSTRPAPGVTAGFGGSATGFNHFGESPLAAPGALELTPHGDVHTQVGGPGGLMSGFDTAPLDPVFWLHHANIDRLWEVWRTQPRRRNPQRAAWLTKAFDFHDEHGEPVRGTPGDVLDTVADLGHRYADLSFPSGLLEVTTMTATPPPDHPAKLVGSTEGLVELTGDRAAIDVALSAPSGPLRIDTGGPPSRVYVNVEDVRAPANPGVSYAGYLSVPDDDDDPTNDVHHIGNISFFGIELTEDPDRAHSGGMRMAFDVTDLYGTLRARPLGRPRARDVRAARTRGSGGRRARRPVAGRRRAGTGTHAPGADRPGQRLLPMTTVTGGWTGSRRRTWHLFVWAHPEWTVAAAAAMAWTGVLAWELVPNGPTNPGPHVTTAGHVHPVAAPGETLAALPASWPTAALMAVLMAAAVMLPSVIPAARVVGITSRWHRRQRAQGVFVGCYLSVWSAFGVVVTGVVTALLGLMGDGAGRTRLAVAALLVAAGWELTPQKRRSLRACHRLPTTGNDGRPADRACARAGVEHGVACLGSCWALMAAASVVGASTLAMAVLTVVVWAEKVFADGPLRWVRGAVVLMAAAAVLR